MLRRINAELFQAPAGARIQIVAESQGNNGFSEARFEYGSPLPPETILGLPGCSFTVEDFTEGVEAVVVFDPDAPGSARYDLFEVEGGVKSDLGKFVRNSDSAPQIGFALQPVAVPVRAAARRSAARKGTSTRKAAKKRGRKTAAKRSKTAARKAPVRRSAARKKATGKKTLRRAAGTRQTSSKRTARKRAR
jgi:hypothetical protein